MILRDTKTMAVCLTRFWACFGPVHYVLPGKQTIKTTSAAPIKLRLFSKNHKQNYIFFHKSLILTGAAKMNNKEAEVSATENLKCLYLCTGYFAQDLCTEI